MSTTPEERRRRRAQGVGSEEPGLIGSILHQLKTDALGAGKTALAIPFTGLEAFGAAVPFTWEDLETKDLVGAALFASMFVSGGVAQAVKGVGGGVGALAAQRGARFLPSLTGVASKEAAATARAAAAKFGLELGKFKSLGLLVGSEAAAGAFFGSLRPIESAENRLEAVLKDATLFGSVGGAFGVAGYGVKATVGKRWLEIKESGQALRMGFMVQAESFRNTLGPSVGRKFRDPLNNREVSVFLRQSDSKGVVSQQGKPIAEFNTYEEALVDALNKGYLEDLGVNPGRLSVGLNAAAKLDEGTLGEMLQAAEVGDIAQLLNQANITQYKHVRDFIKGSQDKENILSHLGLELVTDRGTTFSPISLKGDTKLRNNLIDAVPDEKVRGRLRKIEDDTELVRQAMMYGVVDIKNIVEGSSIKEFAKDLVYNGAVADAEHLSISALPAPDIALMSYLNTPRWIAKWHPEAQPLVDLATVGVGKAEIGKILSHEFRENLETDFSKATLNSVVDLIEKFKDLSIKDAQALSRQAAVDSGDTQVLAAFDRIVPKLEEIRLRYIGAGRLGQSDVAHAKVVSARQTIQEILDRNTPRGGSADLVKINEELANVADPVVKELVDNAGLSGYFPIVNLGDYSARVGGKLIGRFGSKEEAILAVAAKGGDQTATLSRGFSFASESYTFMTPKEYQTFVGKLKAASDIELTTKEAAKLASDAKIFPSVGGKKFAPNLMHRNLGLREFSEDPLNALSFYLSNSERTLALNTFEREANQLINNIPSHKSVLKAWAGDYRDRVLGRPLGIEIAISNTLKWMEPEMASWKLRKYSAALRGIQSNFKLGGWWSGVVNLTQIAMNTTPKIGPRWTIHGIRKFLLDPEAHEVALKRWAGYAEMGSHATLMAEGATRAAEKVTPEIAHAVKRWAAGKYGAGTKAAVQAARNLWMFPFNEAERFNRFVTAEGAYARAIAKGVDEDAAIQEALQLVRETQFDYSVANMPIVLSGPVGAVLGQFKSFFINEAEFIAGLSEKELMGFATAMVAMGGASSVFNLPGVDMVNRLSHFAFDKNIDEALKIGLQDAEEEGEAGKVLRSLTYGAPGLLDIDMSNYIGPGGIYELTRGLFGPSISDISDFAKFIYQGAQDWQGTGTVQQPTITNFMLQIMPSQLRRAELGVGLVSGLPGLMQGKGFSSSAAGILQTGEVRNSNSGKLIYRPEERVRTAWQQFIGAPTTRMSYERAADNVVHRSIEVYTQARAGYRKQLALALIRGNQEEAAQIRQEALRANHVFSPGDLQQAIKDFSAPASVRRQQNTPKALRERFGNLFDSE